MRQGGPWLLVQAVLVFTVSACDHDHSLIGSRRRHFHEELAQPKHRACGTSHDNPLHGPQIAAAERRTYGAVQAALGGKGAVAAALAASAFPNSGVTLPITFHVVRWRGYSSTADMVTPPVTEQQVAAQVDVLNADYSGTGLQFAAPAVRFYDNQRWAGDCWGLLGEILDAVVKAPGAAVNILVCDLASSGGILGVMPDMPNGFNELDSSQAVAIDYRSMPGGPYTRYSGGRTLTHELGHFLGLLHTFGEGSCKASGGNDGIFDTPAQNTSSNGCPIGKDSCPDQPGVDAVNNFMDYSDDSCMQLFSLGQTARMQAVMLQYRPTLLATAMRLAAGNTTAAGSLPKPSPPPPRPPPPRLPAPRLLAASALPPQAKASPPVPGKPQLLHGRKAQQPAPRQAKRSQRPPAPPPPRKFLKASPNFGTTG
ncbi:hypothetical protein ABPG75_007477 [Micractinium tetrahymenae]